MSPGGKVIRPGAVAIETPLLSMSFAPPDFHRRNRSEHEAGAAGRRVANAAGLHFRSVTGRRRR